VSTCLDRDHLDTLNAKAAIARAKRRLLPPDQCHDRRPVRALSGQTMEGFWTAIEHADPLIVGVNCSLGAREMRPYVAELSRLASCLTSAHPNAGLPNAFGGYDETPDVTSALLHEFSRDGLLNVVGSCCGSTPEHTRAIATSIRGLPPRQVPPRRPGARFSGLEPFSIEPDTGFVLVGERTNVTGSARFRRLVEAGDWSGAVDVALEQVRGGANFIDVNMDADLLEGEEAMRTFLNVIATEPEVARPVMIRQLSGVSSRGLQSIQGKESSTDSLKEGEAEFPHARRVRDYGAGVIVMAFDERQATTVERRIAICERAYRLLVDEVGSRRRTSCSIRTCSPSRPDRRARRLCARVPRVPPLIKEHCPGVRTSGASRTSASFRGNDRIREAMHAVFLYHAIRAGLDMGIVNAASSPCTMTSSRAPRRVEDVTFNRRPDATDRPVEIAERVRGEGTRRVLDLSWREARWRSAGARARARHRRLCRGGHRRGTHPVPPAARSDRRAPDGRHAGRRRPVRVGPDVPAAGRQVRACDETRRCLSPAVHGGRAGRRT
jgi:5-methyltetrahydrofolate--homocysteine methyltransferase